MLYEFGTTFCTDIDGPQKMNLTDSGDPMRLICAFVSMTIGWIVMKFYLFHRDLL